MEEHADEVSELHRRASAWFEGCGDTAGAVGHALTVVTLRADFAGATGAHADALTVTGVALVAMRQWTFLLGPGLIPGVNALFLGYVMYRARLVPRFIPIIGLVGAPLIITSATVTMFGGWEQVSLAGALCALPIAAWEFSLGVWLTFKGFRATPPTPPLGHGVLPVG